MRQWQMLFSEDVPLSCDRVMVTSDGVIIHMTSTASVSQCPCCHHSSSAVHSCYQRTLADLPWQGKQVILKLGVRKFLCRQASCKQSVFTERLPQLMARYARRTTRLVMLLEQVGVNTGGETGARLAEQIGIALSSSSVLRIIRSMPVASYAPPSVIGVDEWAYRRGHRYGTLLCDLERHRPMELLPERSADTFAQWLQRHPGITVISRDRGDEFKRGATLGAPQAIQVADRFHLLRNLRNAMIRIMDRHRSEVRSAAKQTLVPVQTLYPSEPQLKQADSPLEPPPLVSKRVSKIKKQNRIECFRQVHELHQRGLSQRDIARKLGINRETVGRYLRSTEYPERNSGKRSSGIIPFLPYLLRRWQEGCHVGKVLFQELQAQGYRQSIYTLYRLLVSWRLASQQHAPPMVSRASINPSSKLVANWILMHSKNLAPQEKAFLSQLALEKGELKLSMELATQFATLLRHRQVAAFPHWLKAVDEAEHQSSLKSFAHGLRQDLAAVGAAIALPWNNGQLEGQINRLKLIKRQMYGRGNFDLLRARFLGAA